jgi:hypothetical protein
MAGLTGRPLTLAAGTGAALPVIVSAVHAVQVRWEPTDDKGIIATRAYDVLTAHTPLVGQYSMATRITGYATHGLGPMLFWLIALPVRIGSPVTMAVTVAVANTVAVLATVALARRRGGPVLMFATAVAIAPMCMSLAAESFHDIWNPAAALLPFLALIFLCWSVACGDHRLLPITVLVASFVVQAHLAYLPPAAGMLIIGLAGLSMRARRDRSLLRWGLATILVGVVCWLPTIVDEVSSRRGNLSLVVRSVTTPVTTLGAGLGAHAIARAVGWRPWWLIVPGTRWDRYHDVLVRPTDLRIATTVGLLAALGLVAAAGWRRRRWDLATAALIALVLCLTLGAVAAHTPVQPVLASTVAYTLWWGSQCGMWVWLILGWAGGLALAARLHVRVGGRAAAVATVAGLAAVGFAGTVATASEKPDQHVALYRPLARIATRLGQAIPRAETVRLDGTLDVATLPFKAAVRFFLVRRGIRVLSRGAYLRNGDWYELHHRPYDLRLVMTDVRRRPVRRMSLLIGVGFTENGARHAVLVWTSPGPVAGGGGAR